MSISTPVHNMDHNITPEMFVFVDSNKITAKTH